MEYMVSKGEDNALLENYLGLLNSLSREYKIKLVESLNRDIGKNTASSNDWIDRLYGSFISEISAEEMIAKIRTNRRFTREIKGF